MRYHVLLLVISARALVLRPGFRDTISSGCVHREPGFAPPLLVEHLREDVAALAAAGRFEAAGSGRRGRGASNGMRVATFADPIDRGDRGAGNWDAFAALWDRLDVARVELAEGLGWPLLESMEIHYVLYPPGGFFERHVDDFVDARDDGAPPPPPSRRAISFICYLNDADWAERDGGALRIHGSPAGAAVDILPEGGSLVLFDSLAVEHEVLPTNRDRTCLVGWFHAPAA